MKKKYVQASLIIMSILFVIGFVILFSSTDIGKREGDRAVQANGGSMSTDKYYIVINSTIENFRTAGMIISLVGGLGMLMSGYGLYKEIE